MAGICKHYGECGGCDFQETAYDGQLEYKATYCRNLYASFGCAPEPIIGSPEQAGFRNKMEFVVSGTAAEPKIGQRVKARYDLVVDLAECAVFTADAVVLLEIVKQWMRESGIEPYDARNRSGELRYITLRHSKAYNEILVTVVCALEPDELARHHRYRGLYERLAARLPVTSLFLACNKERSDTAFAGEPHFLSGNGYIREKVNGIDYIIKPRTFFQTNTACCERLYSVLREASAGMEGRIYDVYCGSGGITLQLASMGRQVTGIDLSARNIEDARQNACLNGLAADFVCQDADEFLIGLKDREPWSMIVDPPRNGLTGSFMDVLIAAGPADCIYVSCNPLKLHGDLKKLSPWYAVRRIAPVDMFPHTRHIEVVAVLRRK